MELVERVKEIVSESSEPRVYLEDVVSYGCQSGMVSELIYTVDCENWFDRYSSDILELVKEYEEQTGDRVHWGDHDNIKTFLAWWSFEYVCWNLLNELENEVV